MAISKSTRSRRKGITRPPQLLSLSTSGKVTVKIENHIGMQNIRAIDLFCGAGGSSWGAHSAGAEIVAGFDKWEMAGRVYQDNFPGARFFATDLANVDPLSLKSEFGKIDLILASPECTNHSPAKGSAPRCEKSRETAFHVIRFAQALQPRWIIIENVINMRKWSRYQGFKGGLETLGYHVREQLLNSSDFNVPQTRRRLFLLCDRETMPPEVRPRARSARGARSIINPNGAYSFSPLFTPRRAPATLARAERAIAVLGGNEPFLIVYYGSDQAGGWQTLDRPLRTITTLDRFAFVKPGQDGHLMRMLQPEELKLAMSWPEHFKINHGTRRDRIRMIGNAVCQKVIRAAVRHLALI